MARIRTIKPEFWTDEKLGPMSPVTRLVFLGLISMADDMGRVVHNVKMVDAFVFPWTDDTCADAIETLCEAGRLRSGLTASGQRVLEIAHWKKHQKIDKPNMASALPAITKAESTESATDRQRRKALLASTRDRIFARDGGTCRTCGVTCKRYKDDKYDSASNLAEIDHIQAVADGGGDDDANLQLLCLQCNRRKHGRETSARNADARGAIDDASTNDRRMVDDVSTLHTNDLRPEPTTNDLTNSSGAVPAPLVRKPRKAPDPVKWPDWPQPVRVKMHDRWRSRLGDVPYPQWVAALGPVFGNPPAPWTLAQMAGAYDSWLSSVGSGGPSSPFLRRNPAACASVLSAIAAINDTVHPDDPERIAAIDRLVHGKAA
jgi:hypothetical protein